MQAIGQTNDGATTSPDGYYEFDLELTGGKQAYAIRFVREGYRETREAIEDILRVNTAPGYSEHHTGRAVDIATPGSRPLTEEFEDTDAFRWLTARAVEFGFSMTYPRDNPWGIAYEPWHWAWWGDT